jgi:hypothetical protein
MADFAYNPDTNTTACGTRPFYGSFERYRMHGFDTTLVKWVYWYSNSIDLHALSYTGPGPVTRINVAKVLQPGK